jgi:hypothetical protein
LCAQVLAIAGQITRNPPLQTALTKAGIGVALQSPQRHAAADAS